jgi:hypothetical protein
MPEIFTTLAEWKLSRGYLSALIRGEGGDFMSPGSQNAMVTGQGLTRAFRGPLSLPTLDGSRVFFNTDQSFAGLGSAVVPGSIISSELADGGSDYAVGDTGIINGGDGIAAYEILTVDGLGAVLTYSLTSPGTAYATGANVETTNDGAQPGVGVGFKVNITAVSGGGAGSVFKVQDLLCYIGSGQLAFDGAYIPGIFASSTLSVIKKTGDSYIPGPLTGPFQAGHAQPPAPVIYAKAPPSAGQKLMNGAVSVVIWRISSITGQISLMSEPSNVITLTDGSVIVTMPLPDANGQDYWGIGVVKIGFADLGWYYQLPTSLHGEVREDELTTIDGHDRAVEISWTNGSLLGQDLAPDKAFPPVPGQFAGSSNDVVWLDADGIIYVGEPGFIGSMPPKNTLFASEAAVTYLKINDGLTVRLGKTAVGTLYYVGGSPALEYQVILENQGIEFAQNACIGANGRLLGWFGQPTVIDSNVEPQFDYARDVMPDFAGWNSQTADKPICVGYDALGKYECWIWGTKVMAKHVPSEAFGGWCAPIDLTDQVIGNVIACVTARKRLYLCCSDGDQLAIYEFDAGTGSVMKVQTSDISLMNYFCNLALIMAEARADNTDHPVTIQVVRNYDDANPIADTLSEYEATPRGTGTQVLCPRQPNILNVNTHALLVTMTSQGGDCGINRLRTLGPKWEVLLHQCPAGTLGQLIAFLALEDRCADVSSDFLITADSTSGLVVTFTITGPATIDDHGDGTATVHMTGEPGLVTVTAHQEGNDVYDPAPDAVQTFTAMDCLGPAQIIFLLALEDKCAIPPADDFVISATSSSGLIVSFTIDGPATINDHGDGTATIHLTGEVGTVTVTAHQEGNETYDPAPDVVRTFEAIDCTTADCTPEPGALWWFRPETLSGVVGPEPGWVDSENGYNLVAPAGFEPQCDGEAIPGLVFASDDVLEGPTDVALNLADGYTIFNVMKEASSATRQLMGKTNQATGSGWQIGRVDFGIDNLFIANADYANPNLYYTDRFAQVWPGAFDVDLHLYCLQMFKEGDVGSLRVNVWRDGALIDTYRVIGDNQHSPPAMPVATNEDVEANWGKFSIGDIFRNSGGFVGTLKESRGYAGKLSDVAIERTSNYFRNKFTLARPRRTYAVPVEVGRVTYIDTWENIAPHPDTLAGDVLFMIERYKPPVDAIDFANPLPGGVQWLSNIGFINVGIDDTVSGGTVRIAFAYRVAQGAGESTDFQGFDFGSGAPTAPANPHFIEIITLRGLALGANGAPYQGNNIGALGFPFQDESNNFMWNGFEYQPPVDHSADPVLAVHPNSVLVKVAIEDVGLPDVSVEIVDEGSTGQIEHAGGDSWLLANFVFEAESEETDPDPVPTCE